MIRTRIMQRSSPANESLITVLSSVKIEEEEESILL